MLNKEIAKARADGPLQLRFFNPTPVSLCRDISLNWVVALKLRDTGLLSFDPEKTPLLDEAQETELRFIGALVVSGCDDSMLENMLSSLDKPYCYNLSRMYFDWSINGWKLFPESPNVYELLEDLIETVDLEELIEIRDRLDEVIADNEGASDDDSDKGSGDDEEKGKDKKEGRAP